MKIQQDLRIGLDKTAREAKSMATGTTNFAEVMDTSREKLQMDEFQQLFSQIDEAGSRLARSRSLKDLSKFKSLVKQFVKQTVEYGMKNKQSQSFDRFGESRKLNIVETIDKKLADLTDACLRKEQPALDILGKIGEVKGLLINLYT
ncbi:DUF327 family protein [Bacillus coagulans]|uniref:YaaR family protein n=1 Tax=Heyndrickxia coagulans TaxID=1398 RepID=UPI0013773497|nr:YaaR family protein [Heyndrickxia coagulans]NCG68358.1 DUF327 family protein [Heyndrickxia coagulans]